MALEFCASCKTKVEEGAVRCASCGADLYSPGIFQQVLGWVVVALSLIPFAISEVTSGEKDWRPLITGAAVLVVGIALVITGRARSRGAGPRVVRDQSLLSALPAQGSPEARPGAPPREPS